MPSATITATELADAQRFRSSFGLRTDEAWIRMVAVDPRSVPGVEAFGVPLMPDEMAELDRRARNSDQIFDLVEAYGLGYPDDWAGIFVDQQGDGAVVALFSSHLGQHEADLRQRVSPLASLEVRSARWSLRQLGAFKARVEADQDWLRTIDAWYTRSQVYPPENLVELRISSANPDAPALVAQHFQADGWLKVISDGIGHWDGPTGSLVVQAVGPSGVIPGRSYVCRLLPDDLAAFPDPGFEYETDANGECSFTAVGATGYDVHIMAYLSGELVVVGRGRVTVEAGRESRIDITINEPAP